MVIDLDNFLSLEMDVFDGYRMKGINMKFPEPSVFFPDVIISVGPISNAHQKTRKSMQGDKSMIFDLPVSLLLDRNSFCRAVRFPS